MIVHDDYIDNLFAEFEHQSILEYPYFFIGVNTWFDDAVIEEYHIEKVTQGFIGTIPWQPLTLNINEYNEEIQHVVRDAEYLYQNVSTIALNNIPSTYFKEEDDVRNNYMIYAYDAMYTLAYTMQEIENNPSEYDDKTVIEWLDGDDQDKEALIGILDDIIVNKLNFSGVSGNVLFDEKGDRIKALYSFGNALINGTMQSFGYLYQNSNGEIIHEMNRSM